MGGNSHGLYIFSVGVNALGKQHNVHQSSLVYN